MGKVSFSCLVKLLLHLVDFISSSMSPSNPENLKPVQGLRVCHLVFCFAWLQNFILYHFIILKLLVPILCLSVSFHRSCLLWHPLNVSHKSHLQQKIGSNSLSLLGCPSLASRVSDAGPTTARFPVSWESPSLVLPFPFVSQSPKTLYSFNFALQPYAWLPFIRLFLHFSWRELRKALDPVKRWWEKKAMLPLGLASRRRVWLFTPL